MGQILGGVTIRNNGTRMKTKDGAQLNPGGYTNTSHIGNGKVWGSSKKFQQPTMQVTIAADEDVDVIEINAITGATLTWEGDNGVDYMMTGAEPQEPFVLNSDTGEITGTFQGDKVEKI